MKTLVTLCLLVCLLVVLPGLGCNRHESSPREIVILLDVSSSIDAGAVDDCFVGIETVVTGLPRGDRLTIIPILGDAQNDAPSMTLRFEAPTKREAYDNDLQQFRELARQQIEALRTKVSTAPSTRTDILGTIQIAAEAFSSDSQSRARTLVVLSDFLQDDGTLNFNTDPRLASESAAQAFAEEFSREQPAPIGNTQILLETGGPPLAITSSSLGVFRRPDQNKLHFLPPLRCSSIGLV